MRERGVFGTYAVLLIATVVFFSITSGKSVPTDDQAQGSDGPSVVINGRSFEPSVVESGEEGRMIVIVDQQDLFVGENTLEIYWGSAPPSTMTADLPSERQKH